MEREVWGHQALEICVEEIVILCDDSKKNARSHFDAWADGHGCTLDTVRKPASISFLFLFVLLYIYSCYIHEMTI